MAFALIVLPIKNEKNVKIISLSGTVVLAILSISGLFLFNKPESGALSYTANWIGSLGTGINFFTDGLSALLLFLTNVLMPLIILTGWKKHYVNSNYFYALILFMQFALNGVFTAGNAFLFYIFWELALIPIYFIILIWGGNNRQKITLKFFVYTLAGSLLMLLAFIYIYFKTPGHSFNWNDFVSAELSAKEQGWLFLFMFMAFAIKLPVFPFHSWQPETYNTAPVQGVMLLSGIMLKMAIYGALRWMLPVIPEGVREWADVAIVLSVIGILYGSVIVLRQNNMKIFIAYASLAHVGFMAASIFPYNAQSLQGLCLQMFSHGVVTIGLFYIYNIFEEKLGEFSINDLGGIRSVSPVFTSFFMLIMLGSIGIPLSNVFVGEFLMFTGLYIYSPLFAVLAGISIVAGAVFMLYMFQRVMLGELRGSSAKFTDIGKLELFVLTVLVLFIYYFGVHPKPLMLLTESFVNNLISVTGSIQ